MIVPMTKYHFLVHLPEKEAFLESLMELGVVHVVAAGSATTEEAEQLAGAIRDGEAVVKRFEKRDVHLAPEKPPRDWEAFPILTESAALEQELEDLKSRQVQYEKNIRTLEPWGHVPHGRLAALEKAGIHTRFYHYPENKFDASWAVDHALEIINRTDNRIYFMVFFDKPGAEFPVAHVTLPKTPIGELYEQLEQCLNRQHEIEKQLNDYASTYLPYLKEHIVMAKDRHRFMTVRQNVDDLDSHRLTLVEGWCPVTKEEALRKFLDANGFAYTTAGMERSGETEKAPVLLKNNRFAQLFEPIGEMFSLPAYSEMDLTAFFAPFFLLFFGFCLGDAGYGVILLLAATITKYRIRKKYKPFATLIQLFGVSTIVLGFFSGTLFGIEMLKSPAFESMRSLFLTQDQLFNAALVIGFVQILFGMGVQVYKKIVFEGWVHGLNKIGWILLLLSLVDIMLLKKLGSVSIGTAIAGAALVIFFGSPKDGALKSFGLGLADLYNVTGVMGDLLSYIRLFALGVSSAILGLVVNNIALSARGIPVIGIVLTILILVIGHTANLMLASLSAFVHPMRLTFVEFYKNVGFEGGGKPYEPFGKKIKNYREEKS